MTGDTSSATTAVAESTTTSEGGDKPPPSSSSMATATTTTTTTPGHLIGIPLPPSNAFSHDKSPGDTRASLNEVLKKESGDAPIIPHPTPTTTTAATKTTSPLKSTGITTPPLAHIHQHHIPHMPHMPHLPYIHKETPTPTSVGSEVGGSVPPSPSPDKGIMGGVFRRKSVGKDGVKEKERFMAGLLQLNGSAKRGDKDKSGDERISRAPSRASSIKSTLSTKGDDDDGGKHKFTLKDLLANGPKLSRRSSQKSVGGSSRRSDSDYEHEGPDHPTQKVPRAPRSQAGESVGSLSQKYGVCAKVAIGKGATSVVRLAHKWDRAEEKLYAVKEFRKRRKNESEKEYVKKLTAEFCISSTLHHPNIVETVDLVQDENQKWCEVMEFCPGGDLYAAIKKGGMSPAEVECCFKQICSGIAYLHSQGVAHRDLKPENMFFDTMGKLKIGDYGASTVYRLPWEKTVHMSTGLCGSEPYIAPEQFLGRPYDARLVDIWAVGIVYYCLHFQELPWRVAQQSDEMYREYATACQQFPLPASREQAEAAITGKDGREKHGSHGAVPGVPPTINNLSPRACRPLIRHMLEPDPKKRATIEEVQSYTWYKSIPICFEQENPGHVHANARAMASVVVKEVWD